MSYWITVRNGKRSQGFEAATPFKAIAKIEAYQRKGYEVVRIIDADGVETTESHLRFAVETVRVEWV